MKKIIATVAFCLFSNIGFAATVEQMKVDITNTVVANLAPVVDEEVISGIHRSVGEYLALRLRDGSITGFLILPLTFQPDNISATNGVTVRIALRLPNVPDFTYVEVIANPVDNKTNSRGIR